MLRPAWLRQQEGSQIIELVFALSLLLTLTVPLFMQVACLEQAQALAINAAQEASLQAAKGADAYTTASWAADGWLDHIETATETRAGIPGVRVTVWVRVRKVGPFQLVTTPFLVHASSVSALR